MSQASTYTDFARPAFIVDHASIHRDMGHQIDWALVGEEFRDTPGGIVTVGVAGAAQSATSVPVLALISAIKAGTVLWFGTNKYAEVTTDAAAGATSLVTLAIPTALVSGDKATVAGSGKKTIRAGTVMHINTTGNVGRMIPYASAGTPVASGLIATTAIEDVGGPFMHNQSLTGFGLLVGGVIFENLLPEATGTPKVLASGVKTSLAANSKGFLFRQYADTRAT